MTCDTEDNNTQVTGCDTKTTSAYGDTVYVRTNMPLSGLVAGDYGYYSIFDTFNFLKGKLERTIPERILPSRLTQGRHVPKYGNYLSYEAYSTLSDAEARKNKLDNAGCHLSVNPTWAASHEHSEALKALIAHTSDPTEGRRLYVEPLPVARGPRDVTGPSIMQALDSHMVSTDQHPPAYIYKLDKKEVETEREMEEIRLCVPSDWRSSFSAGTASMTAQDPIDLGLRLVLEVPGSKMQSKSASSRSNSPPDASSSRPGGSMLSQCFMS